MQQRKQISTTTPPLADLYDITRQEEAIVKGFGEQYGMVNVWVQDAPAGLLR